MNETVFISAFEFDQDGVTETLKDWYDAQFRDESQMTEDQMIKVEVDSITCYIKPPTCKPTPPNLLNQALCNNKCLRDAFFLDLKTHGLNSHTSRRLNELGVIGSESTGFKKMRDIRNRRFADTRGDFFSGTLEDAENGTSNHYQVVHGENLGKTPVIIHISDNINSAGQGAHKMWNGTISTVVMDTGQKEIINLNEVTSTTKATIPFPPLEVAPLNPESVYNDTPYESEFEMVPSSFQPEFLIDLVMRSNVPLVQRAKRVPRPGVNQFLLQTETTMTPKCLIGLPLLEPTPIQTNRLYDTHDQRTSDDYWDRMVEFAKSSGFGFHPGMAVGDYGWIQHVVKSSSRNPDDQKKFVIKLGGFHIFQNACASISRIYSSILYIPNMLGEKHIGDGKNHNSCRAYYETMTILICKHPDRVRLLEGNPMLNDVYRWGLLLMAMRLCSCRVEESYQKHFGILQSIDYLYSLLDLFYEGNGHNYVKYAMREKSIEYPKIEGLMAENYSFANWVGTHEGVPMDEGAEHKVRHYKGNMRHNHRNQFLRLHATDICREYAEIVGPITSLMDKIVGVVTGKPAKNSIIDTDRQLKEANEKLFVKYAKPIQDELDRQVKVLNDYGGALPEGKYLPMGLVELAQHSDSVGNVNRMIQVVFNNNVQRSLKTPIPNKFMSGSRHQKKVSPQLLRDIFAYATSKADLNMSIASLDIYAPAIETRDHTYIISPTESWLSEQRENWNWDELTSCLIVFWKGVGIKGPGILGRMEVSDWAQHKYQLSEEESHEEAFLNATLQIFKLLWPTRAWSLIRGKTVSRPTFQESKFVVGRGLHSLWPNVYDAPDDEPRELIQKIARCNCKTRDKNSQLLCFNLKCKCANRLVNPGCNVLCGCMAEECFQKNQVPLTTESLHNLSIDENIPESPDKRRRTMETESSSSASSSCDMHGIESVVDTDSDIQLDEDTHIDEIAIETELVPVVYLSRRLTKQQRDRLAPSQAVALAISKENFQDPEKNSRYYIDFEGFGAILGCFDLQYV